MFYKDKMTKARGAWTRAKHKLSTNQLPEAERWARRALQLWEDSNRASELDSNLDETLGELIIFLAECCKRNGKAAEAKELKAREKRMQKAKERAEESERAAFFRSKSGRILEILWEANHFLGSRKGDEFLNLATSECEKINEEDKLGFKAFEQLAELLIARQRYSEAEVALEKYLSLLDKTPALKHLSSASTLHKLGNIKLKTDNPSGAEDSFKRALAVEEQYFARNQPTLKQNLKGLAAAYYQQKNYADATEVLIKLIPILENPPGSEHELVDSLNTLAIIYTTQQKYGEAEALFKRALSASAKLSGSLNLTVRANYASLLRQLNRVEEADKL